MQRSIIRRAVIPKAVSGLDADLDTNERVDFAQSIKRVGDRGKLLAIKGLIESEQQSASLNPQAQASNTYALGFIRDRLEWLDSDRTRGDLDPTGAPPAAVPDASIRIAKKADVTPSDKTPDLLEIVADAPLYSATDEMVDTGGGKEPLPIPDHDHYAKKFGKKTTTVGVGVKRGQFATSPGSWFTSPFAGCVGPFWGVMPVPDRTPFKAWFPDSIDAGPAAFAALSKSAAVPFVVTKAPMADAAFQAAAGDLFPRPPVREDIRQGELADCGLLAILDGIVTREPWFIQQMLRDVGGGRVVVRLFDIAVKDDNAWVFTPRLVTIEKSTVVRHQHDLFAGSGRDNLGALWVPMIEKAYVAAGYLATSTEITNALSTANTEGANMDFVYGHVRGAKADVVDVQLAEQPAKGDRRAATYSKPMLEWYGRIRKALDDKKVVVLESNAEITSKGSTTKGHSGGEQVAKGLVGGHAYSVLGTKTVDGRFFLVVRNPWGKYGREYDWKAAQGSVAKPKDDAGEFMLELNDATKRFKKVMISSS